MDRSIWLPLPPSVNHIWRQARGRTYLAKNYTRWIQRAQIALRAQVNKHWKWKGPIEVHIEARRGKGWNERKRDLDNMAKPVLDFLVREGMIPADDHTVIKRLVIELASQTSAEAEVWVSVKHYGEQHEQV